MASLPVPSGLKLLINARSVEEKSTVFSDMFVDAQPNLVILETWEIVG